MVTHLTVTSDVVGLNGVPNLSVEVTCHILYVIIVSRECATSPNCLVISLNNCVWFGELEEIFVRLSIRPDRSMQMLRQCVFPYGGRLLLFYFLASGISGKNKDVIMTLVTVISNFLFY